MSTDKGTLFKPSYTTFDNVQVRLANKVLFQQDPNDLQDGEISNQLLSQLIVDAETKVEQDMRSRYAVPFRSDVTGDFNGLPSHSKRAIRTAVDLKCIVEILGTDFGRGTHVNAENYLKWAKEEYKNYMVTLLGYDPESSTDEKHKRFRFAPPIEHVLLAKTNRFADDGYKGMIINTDSSDRDAVTYAEEQINNPSRSYINRRLGNPAEG